MDGQEPVVEQQPAAEATVTMSKAEFEGMQRTLRETQESERNWAKMATRGAAPVQEAAVIEEDDDGINPDDYVDAEEADPDDSPTKIVADFADQGAQALSKRGFVTKREAQRIAADVAKKVSQAIVGQAKQEVQADNQLFTKFPELKDTKSPLYKETAARFQEAIALDPKAAKSPGSLFLAAKAAQEHLGRQEDSKRRTRDAEDEDEQDRRQRAASQDGRTRGRSQVDDDDDQLSSEDRTVMAGLGISEAEFAASKKQLAKRGR